MSGIKGVIKYISQLLILSSFSIIFLPIICLKCYEEKSEISIFKFMQWSIGKSTKSFLDADMEFVIGRQMKIYIVCALIWVMVTVIFTIIILLVQSQLSYYIAIVAQLFTILSGGLIYLMLRMETKGPILEKISNTSEDYLGTKALFPVKSLLIWGGIQLLALILNFAGALLKEKKRSGRHQEMYIAPEEMVGDRRSGMQRTVKTQATEYVPQRRNENRIKKDWGMDQQRSRMQGRSTFSGAIRGLQRMYEKKVYPMSMGEAVWICSDGVHIFMTKADQSIEHELLAEVFYVAEYEEYWLTPEKKRMVFLESGQPLGEKREYYIPRGTIIQVSYSNNIEPMRFELAYKKEGRIMNYDETVFVNPDKLGLDEGDTLDELYRKLGKAYYEGAFEDPLPQLLPLFDKITKIKGLSAGRGQQKRDDVPAQRYCPSCGKLIDGQDRFCGGCGYDLNDVGVKSPRL